MKKDKLQELLDKYKNNLDEVKTAEEIKNEENNSQKVKEEDANV